MHLSGMYLRKENMYTWYYILIYKFYEIFYVTYALVMPICHLVPQDYVSGK